MSSNFVKRYNAIGWDWYLESYDWSSWVSQPVKDIIESLETENAKLRELCADMHKALFSLNLDHCQACPREDACVFMHKSFDCDECAFERDMRELGIEVKECTT